MPSTSLQHLTPKPACASTRTLSGSVLVKTEGTSKRKARQAAEDQARRTASTKLRAAWRTPCPKRCGPGVADGDDEATLVHLQTVKLAPKRWLSYYAAYWSVEITCD